MLESGVCKTIKQKIKFNAKPDVIYEILTDSKTYSAVTGKRARIGTKAGDAFSVYGGRATGIIVELVRNRRIVQAWRGHSFPEGIFSMATFNLRTTASDGTELILVHRGVPKELISIIALGWRKYNWDPIKKYLTRPS